MPASQKIHRSNLPPVRVRMIECDGNEVPSAIPSSQIDGTNWLIYPTGGKMALAAKLNDVRSHSRNTSLGP